MSSAAKETATANGIGHPTTVDSPSGRPTFVKRNPHLSGKIAIEEHVNTDIFNSLSTNPYTKGSNEGWEGTYYQKTFMEDVQYRLGNIEERIKQMDAAGIAIMACHSCRQAFKEFSTPQRRPRLQAKSTIRCTSSTGRVPTPTASLPGVVWLCKIRKRQPWKLSDA